MVFYACQSLRNCLYLFYCILLLYSESVRTASTVVILLHHFISKLITTRVQILVILDILDRLVASILFILSRDIHRKNIRRLRYQSE